jgi:uncharacterized BrkB/YihY/UPF0761 family membrane protein
MGETEPPSEQAPGRPGRVQRWKDRASELRERGRERLETERQRRPSVRVVWDFYRRDREFAGSLLAGGLAVKLFLWILPFSLAVIVLIGSLAEGLDRPPGELAQETGLTTALAGIVADAVEASGRAGVYLAVLAVVLVLWAGLGVARAVRLVSRLAWEVETVPRFNPLLASLAVVGFAVSLVGVTFVLRALQGGPLLTDLLALAFGSAVLAVILVVVFRALPHPEGVPWTAMVPGALLATAGILILRVVTIVYFSRRLDPANDLYGGLGLAAVFIVWLYIIARLLVAAISLNATVWARYSAIEEQPLPP